MLTPHKTLMPAVGSHPCTPFVNNVDTKLVAKFIMAFGSPESAGILRLAQMVFTVELNGKNLSSIHRLDQELQLALYRAVNTLHTFSMEIRWTLTPAVSHDHIMQVGHYSI